MAESGRLLSSVQLAEREFVEEDTPSRREGLSKEKEDACRLRYCDLIASAGDQLGMHKWTQGVAMLFTHKYYVHCPHAWRPDGSTWHHSHSHFEYVATAALHLAGKVEENQKPLNDIVFTCHTVIKSGKRLEKARAKCSEDPKFFQHLKHRILEAEKNLLHQIGFALNVPHLQEPIFSIFLTYDASSSELTPDVRDSIWRFVNDSYHTTVCVQYDVLTLAASMLVLALKHRNKSASGEWWRQWLDSVGFRNISTADIRDVASQMCDFYYKKGGNEWPGPKLQQSIEQELTVDHEHFDTESESAAAASSNVHNGNFTVGTTPADKRTQHNREHEHTPWVQQSVAMDGESNYLSNEDRELPYHRTRSGNGENGQQRYGEQPLRSSGGTRERQRNEHRSESSAGAGDRQRSGADAWRNYETERKRTERSERRDDRQKRDDGSRRKCSHRHHERSRSRSRSGSKSDDSRKSGSPGGRRDRNREKSRDGRKRSRSKPRHSHRR